LVCTGPLPALWPLAAVALYVRLARRADGWRRVRAVAGLAIVVGLALPWYGAMIERHGGEFLSRAPFFPYALGPRGSWFMGPFVAVSFVVVGFYPWSALLPGIFLHAAMWWPRPRPATDVATAAAPDVAPMARELTHEHASHFFIACAAAALLPLVFYPAPPLPAVLPALPALALLSGRFLDHLIEDPERLAASLSRGLLMLALTGTVAAVLLALLAGRLRDAAPELGLLATALFAMAWLPLLAGLTRRRLLAALLMTLPAAVGAPLVSLRVMPALEGYLTTRAVAETMNRRSPPRAPLVLADEPPPSLRLYAARNLVHGPSLAANLRDFRAADGYAYVAFRPGRERDVAGAAPGPLEVLARTPSLVLARVGSRAP
jgi:hypothetical protein